MAEQRSPRLVLCKPLACPSARWRTLAGVIDTHEWITGVAKLVPDSDPAKVKADLKAFDKDDDGKLDFSEYCAYMAAWDTSGATVLRPDQVKRLADMRARFTTGSPPVVSWGGFLSIAREFIPQSSETIPLDETFGRSVLASAGMDPEHVNSLTFGECVVCLTVMWHGPPQGQTVAYYVRNFWNADGSRC